MRIVKKISLALLLFLVLVGTFGFHNPVYAQDISAVPTIGPIIKGVEVVADVAGVDIPTPGDIVKAGASSALSGIVDVVAAAILTFANLLLGLAGTLLNWVVVKTVFQFGSIIGNSPGVLAAWGILRDIGNMMLLFGFIFMGLATILNLHTFAVRKALPPLIIVAILMNFSLFAAEAVIDTSNALSSALYKQANTSPCTDLTGDDTITEIVNGSGGQSREDCAVNFGLAGHIMQSTGLSSILAADGDVFANASVYLGLALFATIGAVVLFAASIMLIIRLIVLTFVMVAAPIGFIGMAIPPLRRFASDWWRRLFAQSFFAPILFLLIFISLKVTDSFTGVAGSGTTTGLAKESLAGALTQPGASVMGIILVFAIVIGFLIASLIAAKNMGAAGAGIAVKTAGWATYGTMGYVGRNTMGRKFNTWNENIRKSEFGQSRIGRRVALITEKGAKGTYDFRGTKAGGALSKRVGDLGKPPKEGYVGQVKRSSDAYTKYASTLNQTKAAEARESQLKKKKERINESKRMEDQRWENERKEKNSEINTVKESLAQREKERATQASRLNAAISSGDQAAYRRESEAMNSLMENHQKLDAEANEKLKNAQTSLESAQKQHEQFTQGFNDELKKVDVAIKGDVEKGIAGVDANSSKRAFAINIKNDNFPPTKGAARTKASKAIVADLKKSKAEKAIEGLKHSLDEGNKDASHKLDDVKHAIDEETKATKDHGGGGDHGGDSHGDHH